MPVYIIEHLEPRLWKWCMIEYEHISENVGKDNLWFTNVKKGSKKLEKYGKVMKESVKAMNLKNACILDPEAQATLTPEESSSFDYFIFGGILGDSPPRKRTRERLTQFMKGIEMRNIGKKQFSTDNAVFVTKEIAGGKRLEKMEFR
jgi:ribosome biogenesis SPOUT family RNA methylase Rps3